MRNSPPTLALPLKGRGNETRHRSFSPSPLEGEGWGGGYLAKLCLSLCLGTALLASSAHAADKVRAGKAVATSLPMAMLDLGVNEGIFAKYGIEPEIIAFTGDARLQQAFAAESVDIGLGSGPAMAFQVKGAPSLAVAAFAGPPRTISVAVIPDSPIKKASDLKGKTLAISTTGSLTEWLARRLAVKEGWGPEGVKTIALGAGAAMNGPLFTKQVDAMMTGTENALLLVEKKQVRIVTGMEDYAPDFITHVVFASNSMIEKKPEIIGRFLQGFFASMQFAKANKAKTVAFLAPLFNEPADVTEQIYDHEMPMMIEDGHFDPKAVAVLKDSFLDMGILDKKPEDAQLFDARFVPVKP